MLALALAIGMLAGDNLGPCSASGAFQPVSVLRIVGTGALHWSVIAAPHARRRSASRARRAQREFDRGGKALFMGFVMVGATLLAWLLVSQASAGDAERAGRDTRDSEAGIVVAHRVPSHVRRRAAASAWRWRSASTEGGAVPRPLDECVDEAVWKHSGRDGGPGDAAAGAQSAGRGADERASEPGATR